MVKGMGSNEERVVMRCWFSLEVGITRSIAPSFLDHRFLPGAYPHLTSCSGLSPLTRLFSCQPIHHHKADTATWRTSAQSRDAVKVAILHMPGAVFVGALPREQLQLDQLLGLVPEIRYHGDGLQAALCKEKVALVLRCLDCRRNLGARSAHKHLQSHSGRSPPPARTHSWETVEALSLSSSVMTLPKRIWTISTRSSWPSTSPNAARSGARTMSRETRSSISWKTYNLAAQI